MRGAAAAPAAPTLASWPGKVQLDLLQFHSPQTFAAPRRIDGLIVATEVRLVDKLDPTVQVISAWLMGTPRPDCDGSSSLAEKLDEHTSESSAALSHDPEQSPFIECSTDSANVQLPPESCEEWQAMASGHFAPMCAAVENEAKLAATEEIRRAREEARQAAEAEALRREKEEEEARSAALLATEGVACVDNWERIGLRCALSMQRLTDPAKGGECRHLARCNYETLRRYAGRIVTGRQTCPIAGCQVLLRRTRDVIRDETLAKQLREVPPHVMEVWWRNGELRLTAMPKPPRSVADIAATIDLVTSSSFDEQTQLADESSRKRKRVARIGTSTQRAQSNKSRTAAPAPQRKGQGPMEGPVVIKLE